jgi:hypothetical protein
MHEFTNNEILLLITATAFMRAHKSKNCQTVAALTKVKNKLQNIYNEREKDEQKIRNGLHGE